MEQNILNQKNSRLSYANFVFIKIYDMHYEIMSDVNAICKKIIIQSNFSMCVLAMPYDYFMLFDKYSTCTCALDISFLIN